jgi:hypothetical protein
MKHIDIRDHALKLLSMSKKFLLEDGDLDSTAFIITHNNEQLIRPIELDQESSKLESCSKIVEEARKQMASAIITIFLARSKDFDNIKFEQEDYLWGDIQNSSSQRLILMTLSGPNIKNWAIALPFKILNGKIIFGKQVEYVAGVDLGFFPGWSEQQDPKIF